MRRATVTFILGAFAAATVGAAPFLFDRHDHRNHLHKETASASAVAARNAAVVPEERLSGVACRGGKAGPFSCDGVDLLSFVPLGEFRTEGSTAEASDIWGWTDPGDDGELGTGDAFDGDEYVLITKTDGTSFFRITDPTDPVYLGDLPNGAVEQLQWHDVKIHLDHAFIVSESEPHFMQVFDLRRLRDVAEARTWDTDALYPLNIAAHNIAINEGTGFAYIVGGNEGIVAPDQCLSGLHMVDISEPTSPTFAGCYTDSGGPGTAGRFAGGPVEDNSPAAYVHDTQCVSYTGPDPDHQGREICLNAAEDELTIVDVHDKSATRTISVLEYPDVAYAHQGWLTEDQRYFLLGDELDEQGVGMNTRTIVFDVTDLDAPALHFEHLHDTRAIDHNLYTHDGLVFQSNYTAGLRVLDLSFLDDRRMPELAYFDTFPGDDDAPVAEFAGTWSNYPYFPSGTVAVSGIGEGLFLLQVQDGVYRRIGQTKEKPDNGGGKVVLGPASELDAFFAIGCVTEGSDPRCVSTSYALSAEPGDNSVGNLLALTPLNEVFYRYDGDEPTQAFPADGTLPDAVALRTDAPVEGEVAIHTWQGDRVGAGLTTVYVELTGTTSDGRRVLLGNDTVTQPVLPTGEPTVFPFSFDVDEELDGLVVRNLTAGVAVRGANAFSGFIDGVGGSTVTVPTFALRGRS